ncbi:tuberoinfundibular peptide of 39 residues isoform X2 [Solea solea]|uniref:tuberoinfundibular peptide of 39 residues isoform X2 n=1 Tax=Solea solea TaxID=90069 RepID=UPI002729E697|nr:tuberoinfundibular peptide of 39 residues isoform X2 [Solea solea]
MCEQLVFPRKSFLLLYILGMTLVTTAFPQHRLPLRMDESEESKQHDWDVLFPSIALRDWSVQMMSAPSLRSAADSKAGLMTKAWLFAPGRAEAGMAKAWPSEWSSQGVGMVKRNMVVADDTAFREKSKLLTSMERQKWLNSYMQKLLVVNSSG